jgi:hypothetical protein
VDLRFIERQGRRIDRLIAQMAEGIELDALKRTHNADELEALAVVRQDGTKVQLLHLRAMTSPQRIYTEVLSPLTSSAKPIPICIPTASRLRSNNAAEDQLLQGAVLMFTGRDAFTVQLPNVPGRSVTEPSTERAIFGPKDSFVENIEDNIALVRSHLRDPQLHAERLTLGTRAPTTVAVLSVSGTVDPKMLDDVMERLTNFRGRRVGFVSSLLRPLFGSIWDPFLPAEFTERPYRVADFLDRGHIAILADGSPYALVTPVPLLDTFRDEEEYLQASVTRHFVRTLRMIGFFTAVFAPGLYVAVLTVNTAVMPGLLAIAVAANRQTLPYPIFTETLLMMVVFDIMAEATISMKGILGPAISIVGSLIVGQAAVRANLVSNLGVILLAITALATFITPRYQITYAVRIWKYPILLLSVFGLIGWTVGLLWFLTHLTGQRSLGVHTLSPIAPLLPRSAATESSVGAKTHAGAPTYMRRRAPRHS